jgi:hypothetical protein
MIFHDTSGYVARDSGININNVLLAEVDTLDTVCTRDNWTDDNIEGRNAGGNVWGIFINDNTTLMELRVDGAVGQRPMFRLYPPNWASAIYRGDAVVFLDGIVDSEFIIYDDATIPLFGITESDGLTDHYDNEITNVLRSYVDHSTHFEVMTDSDDWYGWEADEGSTANNALVFVGYSTANATNNSRACWAGYSSQTTLQDKYAYGFVAAPRDAYCIGPNGIVVLVRSSSTSVARNYVNILFDDTILTAAINSMRSTVAGEWNAYQLTGAALPAAWTSSIPTVTLDGIACRGLDIRADVFSSHSNYMSLPKVLVDWD